MAYKNIVLEKDEGITKLIIDRPPVNVMDQETLDEITSALKELGKDEETKVLLIRGAGEKAFCAGVEVGDHIGAESIRQLEQSLIGGVLVAVGVEPGIGARKGLLFRRRRRKLLRGRRNHRCGGGLWRCGSW